MILTVIPLELPSNMPRFSVQAILLGVTVVAVSISGFKTYEQSKLLKQTTERNRLLETRQRTYLRAMQLIKSLNFGSPEDAENQKRILRMTHEIPALTETPEKRDGPVDMWFFGTQTRLIDFVIDAKQFELLVMTYNSNKVPGGVTTALALFQDHRFVDYAIHSESTRIERSHEVHVADSDNDGTLTATIEIAPGMWREEHRTVHFYVLASGLKLVAAK